MNPEVEPEQNEQMEETKEKTCKRTYRKVLQVHDMLLHHDVATLDANNFYVYARPDGERCYVRTGPGKTLAINS